LGTSSPSASEAFYEDIKQALSDLTNTSKGLRRTMRAMALVSSALSTVGIEPVVVGGQALEIYTFGNYATSDIDVVLSGREQAGEILEKIGFQRKAAGFRHWFHEPLDLPIEIPDSILLGSMDMVTDLDVEGYKVKVIGIEDLILNRLRAGVFWNSPSDMTWAKYLIKSYFDELDFKYLEDETQKPENDVHQAFSILMIEGQKERA
jgi:predicted nucleotidyltransferase